MAAACRGVQAREQGETVTDQFTFTVTDEHGATSSSTLTITITGTNDAPVANADTNAGDAVKEAGVQDGGNTAEPGDASASGNVLTNDTDIDTRSEEHTSELQSRGLISYAVFCL